jgi:hypothetical protein
MVMPLGLERGPDGGGVDVQSIADAGEGPTVFVEADRVSDAFIVQALTAHGDALSVQVRRHSDAVNAEPGGQFVDGRAGTIGVDKGCDLTL